MDSLREVAASRGPGGQPSVRNRQSLSILKFFLVLSLLSFTSAPAFASTAEEINAVSTLDALNRTEEVLSNSGKWSALAWDSSTTGHNTGRDTTTGWGPYDAFPTVNGAFWNPATFSDKTGNAAAITLQTGPGNAERYVGLWLNMPNPVSAKTGYQLRWTVNSSTSTYTVTLSKWSAGTQTVLAANSSVSIPVGTTMAISDTGGTVTAWQGTGGTLSSLLSASDTAYTSGYAGMEGSGNISRSINFKAGTLSGASSVPPDTTISGGPKGVVVPNTQFSFSATEPGSSFECALDGAVFGACTSPKTYQGLVEGSRMFRVRATGAGGVDPTPAERGFQVVTAAKATSKVALLDNLERQEVPLATGKWSKSSWAAEIGGAWMGSYRGYGSSGGLAGAYWNPTTISDGEGTTLVAGAVGTGSVPSGQYSALLLNMPNPSGARSGYEARFTGTGSATNYTVELAKWVSGIRTVLASTTGFSLPVGTTMVLTETAGGSLALWTGTTSLSAVLSASDYTYTSGYAGLEVSGGAGTVYNFRAGRIDIQSPDTTITSGPTGTVPPANVSFGFTASESGSSFECSLDGAAYSACSSPKAYPTIASGAHSFRVRAVDAVGNQDATAAERSFQVLQPPTAATAAAAGVSASAATLKATINPNGGETTYQFEYGTTTAYGAKVPIGAKAIGAGSANVEVGEAIAGLSAGTTYHFRISATNAAGTSKGEDRTFTTIAAPTATIEPASDVSANKATLNVLINPKGAATTYQFEYGPTTAYGMKAPATPQGIGSGFSPVPISTTVSGLTEGTTYHYRVVATNSVGKTNAADQSVTTPFLPDAITESAIAVDTDDAVLTGTIDANGSPATYQFEYGTTDAYGAVVPGAVEVIETGNGAEEAEEVASSLQPDTTYHYRLKATSEAGTVVGVDHTFTTPATNVSPPDPGEEVTQPPDFVNLQWSADHQRDSEEYSMRVIANSGAKMLRLGFIGTTTQTTYDQIFRLAAEKGVRILPQWGGNRVPTAGTDRDARVAELAKWVARYGSTGTFWKEFTVPYLPPTHWEIWNEPNVEKNAMPNSTIDPAEFGRFLQQAAGAVRTDPKAQVLVGGLLTVPKAAGDEAHVTPSHFIRAMGAEGAYDAVALHPYVFKARDEQAPNTASEVENVAGRVRNHIYTLRAAMNGSEVVGGATKRIWVTEVGWPVENPQAEIDKLGTNPITHPAVTDLIQRDLLRESIKEITKSRQELKIRALFYYNIQDLVRADTETWEYRAGLRTHNGGFRPAWHAFRLAAGQLISWPATPVAVTEGVTPLARSGTLFGKVNAGGAPTSYRFQWERPDATPEEFDNATTWENAGTGESAIMRSREISGLLPGTEYRYRIVAENVNKDVSKGDPRQFTTEPMSNTTGTFSHLNGEPGWASVHGWSKYDGVGLHGYKVRINFAKSDGTYRYVDVDLNNGQYRLDNYPLGPGTWTVSAAFYPQGPYPESKTNFHTFTVRNGYRLVAKHSQKCLDVYQGMTGEGAPLIQYGCEPQLPLNQVFQLVPMDNQARYQIVARHSNRCVGVPAGTQAVHQLSQTNCLGSAHQIWQGQTVQPNGDNNTYNRFVVQHSGQCMDVFNSSGDNGAIVGQYPCNGAQANQLWTFESVDAGQVPTQTFLTNEPNNSYHGMPGLVSFHGYLSAGDRAYPLAGRIVHVKFDRANGQGVFDGIPDSSVAVTTDGSGYYSYKYWPLWQGDWKGWAVFEGTGDALGKSETAGKQQITTASAPSILSGYRLMFRSTEKCLGTQNNGTVNGTHMVQKTCNTGSTPLDGQVFSLWPAAPIGANHWQLRPNTMSYPLQDAQCVDVNGAQLEDHAEINLFKCVGAANQSWELPPMPPPNEPFIFARAQHSQKCMDVPGGDKSEGLQIRQFQCIWNGNQQLKWILVP